MERSFSARELVIMSSRLQWNTTLVTDIKNTVTALRPTDPTTLNTDTRDRIQSNHHYQHHHHHYNYTTLHTGGSRGREGVSLGLDEQYTLRNML